MVNITKIGAILMTDKFNIKVQEGLSEIVAKEIRTKFTEKNEKYSKCAELKYDNPYFAIQVVHLINAVASNLQEAELAIGLVLEKVNYDGPHTVGSDTQEYGYAGDAHVIYVNTYAALDFAANAADLRKSMIKKQNAQKVKEDYGYKGSVCEQYEPISDINKEVHHREFIGTVLKRDDCRTCSNSSCPI
jgi:hypothetical protein